MAELEHCPDCENLTNADRIRAMTDEELANWINDIQSIARYGYMWSREVWLDWLKQEVEEESEES